MLIWVSIYEVDMTMLNKILHLYRLKPSTHHGYFELLPWDRNSRVISRFPSSFMTGNHDIFSSLELIGKPCMMTSRRKSQDYCKNGKSLRLVRIFIIFLNSSLSHYCFHNSAYLLIFVVFDRLELESQYHDQVRVALAFAREIEDFDNLVNPHHLFDYCLGPEPSKYVLEKIFQEEKSKFNLVILKVSSSL